MRLFGPEEMLAAEDERGFGGGEVGEGVILCVAYVRREDRQLISFQEWSAEKD